MELYEMMEGLIRPIVLVKGFAGFGKILSNVSDQPNGYDLFVYMYEIGQTL
jgi:hypothetical protein